MTRVEVSPPAQVNTLSNMLPSAAVPESMTISKYFLDVSRVNFESPITLHFYFYFSKICLERHIALHF